MKNLILVLAAGYFMTAASAAPITISFNSPIGDLLSNTHAYGSPSVTATGFGPSDAAVNLFGKNAGGDENGMGLVNDASGDHEITAGSYIQLDLNNLIGLGVTSVTIAMNSTTNGETWAIVKDTSAGSLPGSGFTTGTSEGNVVITSISRYLDITASGLDQSGHHSNVLLASLTYDNGGGGGQAVPEPASLALIGGGFGLLGLLRWRKAAVTKN